MTGAPIFELLTQLNDFLTNSYRDNIIQQAFIVSSKGESWARLSRHWFNEFKTIVAGLEHSQIVTLVQTAHREQIEPFFKNEPRRP